MAGAFSFLHRRLCCPRRWRFAEPVPSAVRLIDPKLLVAEPPAEPAAEPWEEPVAQQPAPEEEATPAEEEEVDPPGEQDPEQSLGLPATAGSSQAAAGNERPEPTLAEQHAFLDAAKNYNFRRVRELLLADPRLVNVQPARRWSALHQAAHCGDPRAVRLLLEYGANLQAVTRDGLTPLEVASPNAFDLLLEATMGALEQEAEPGIPKTSEEVIARLHVWRFEPRSGRDYQCQICLEEITEGEELRTLPCAHFFHTGCVDIWLRDRSNSCPTCRHQVV